MIKPDTLNNMGGEYQSKVISLLIKNLSFLTQINDILLPEYFESESRQWIIKLIKSNYAEYKSVITESIVNAALDEEKNEILKVDIIEKFKEINLYKNSTDLNFIKDNFIEFCINQHYKISLYKSIDDLENKDYDAIKNRFKEAAKVGLSSDIGTNGLNEDVESVFKSIHRNTIKTPWDIINDITEGGLGIGDLGILIGNPGAGKTWLLSALGLSAIKSGMHVIHYTLELNEKMVQRRYYSLMTGFDITNLKYNTEIINKKISQIIKHGGKLTIKEYPTKRATIDTINAHFEKVKALSNNINTKYLVIIDYGDLMKAPKFYKEKRLEIGNIFEELRGFAGDVGVPVWTATQSNREGAAADFIQGENVSEDYSKIMIGDFIMSISRKIEDSKNKTARIFIVKNRFGPDKMGFPSKFDVGSGLCEIYSNDSLQGNNVTKEMSNKDDNIKDMLKDKYFNLHGDEKKKLH